MTEIGRAPSRRDYDLWRAGQAHPDQWLSASGIRKAFGNSWARAIDALNVEPRPDILARRLLNFNRPYKREELLEGLRACAAAVGVEYLAFSVYRAWAIEELKRPDRACKRLALSRYAFKKHFGSWIEALVAAGLPELTRASNDDKLPMPRGPAYDNDHLRRALLGANRFHLECEAQAGRGDDRHPPRQLTRRVFEQWRQGEAEAAQAQGRVIYLPSAASIILRLGSWTEALHWAGLIDDERLRAAHRQKARPLTDDEVLDYLVFALNDLRPVAEKAEARLTRGDATDATAASSTRLSAGPAAATPLSRSEYRRWRRGRLLKTEDPWRRPASDSLFVDRFDGWWRAEAMARARRRRPEAELAQLAREVDGRV